MRFCEDKIHAQNAYGRCAPGFSSPCTLKIDYLNELSAERFVSLDQTFFPGRPQLMEELGKRAGFDPDVRFFAQGFSELLGLIVGGAGVAVLPSDVAQLPQPQVVFLALRRPRFSLVSSAAWRKADEDEILLELITLLSRSEADQSK